MVWSCAMACGLWLSQLLEGHPLLSLLCITAGTSPFLNLSAWKRALPWLCAGWGVGLVMGHVTADHQRGAQRANCTEWLLMRPSFLPRMSMANGDRIRGIWHGVDVHGQHVKVWMEVSHIPKPCPQWTLVQLSPIRPSGLTAAFQFDEYLTRQGVRAVGHCLQWMPLEVDQEVALTEVLAMRWRAHLGRVFPSPSAGVIRGIFGGDKKAPSDEVKQAFQRLGIAHLLAVSGYHVGMVSSLFLLLLTTQHRWLKRLSALGVMAAGLFVVACGSPISGVRSWAMMAWVWTAMVRGRRGLGWEALGMVAMAVAMWDLDVSHTLGAQLSFLATASLMALKGRRLALKVPWRAQWATSFLTVPQFPAFPLLFYPINLVAGPVMMLLGILVAGALLGWTWCAYAATSMVEWLSVRAILLAESSWTWCSTRPYSGITAWMWVPLSMHWVIQACRGAVRRRVVWRSMVLTALVGMTWPLFHRATRPLSWHRLRGWPSSWMVHDGFGMVHWSSRCSQTAADNVARNLGLEGPAWACPLGSDIQNESQKKWIQPPFEVWIHRDQSSETSHPVLLGDVSSVSTGS